MAAAEVHSMQGFAQALLALEPLQDAKPWLGGAAGQNPAWWATTGQRDLKPQDAAAGAGGKRAG